MRATLIAAASEPEILHPRKKKFYRPELDILRFFAFFLVFIDHSFPQDTQAYLNLGLPSLLAEWLSAFVRSGGLGVDVFFTLSSYLITELLIREHKRFGSIDVRQFYIRRGLRIYPLYYGFLALVIVLGSAFAIGGYLDSRNKLLFLLPLGNWACVLWGFPPSVAAHLWSISIEEQFYLAYPMVLRFFGVNRIVSIAIGLLVIANVTRVIGVISGADHPALWCNTFARLDPIAVGALAAVWLRGDSLPLTRAARIFLATIGLLVLIVAARYTSAWGKSSLIFYPLVSGASTLILLTFIVKKSFVKNHLTVALIYLGRISYGLYVWHLLALHLTERLKVSDRYSVNLMVHAVTGLLLTVGLAVASYELFESYFLKLKEKFTRVPSRPI